LQSNRAEQFRENAANCLRLAASAQNEQARAMLMHMADAWVRLAASTKEEAAAEPNGSEENMTQTIEPMETKSDEYRTNAFACERNAKEATDRAIKRQWEELAIQWHYMANQAARLPDLFQSLE
jgi:hypothetical protein